MPGTSAVLLVNVGTPADPSPQAVGRYLREFLSDPCVLDIPQPLRWALVNLLIVPRRQYASAKLYQKIWTDRGSPLLAYSRKFTQKLSTHVPFPVHLAMRYGEPSLRSAITALRRQGIQRLLLFPLYPQYSLAATQSAVQAVTELVPDMALSVVPPFYAEPEYLDAVATVSRPYLERSHDRVLFSFHGLPERQVKATDQTQAHCLTHPTCCDAVGESNALCYRAQCFATARALAERLGIPPTNYLVGFQSRLGRTPWIRPYSDEYYRTLAQQGVRRLAVIAPSFVADCLETLEEVALRGKEEFLRHGGEDLFLVPSLNAEDAWVKAAANLCQRFSSPT